MKVLKLTPIVGLLACTSLSSSDDGGVDDGSVDIDTGLTDSGKDTSSDATSDVVTEVGADSGVTTYNDVASSSFWKAFDIKPGSNGIAAGYQGGAFDGKYIYLANNANGMGYTGVIARHDTTMSLSVWDFFNAATADATLGGMYGATFAGTKVYFTSTTNPGGGVGVAVGVYDTAKAFNQNASWQAFSVTTLNPGTGGLCGSAFDGKYLYVTPLWYGQNQPNGTVARYDTTQPFNMGWTSFNVAIAQIDANARGFCGAVYAAPYIYFAPNAYGVVVRYDTTKVFTAPASYETFNATSAIGAGAHGYWGGAFDGKYVYLVPGLDGVNANGPTSMFLRHDTSQPMSAWENYDLTDADANAKGFIGAGFDGKRIFLVPSYSSTLLAYDTSAPFNQSTSYKKFVTTSADVNAKSFAGSVFDGRYLYLIPGLGAQSVVLQFDAKSPASMPPGFSGSFY